MEIALILLVTAELVAIVACRVAGDARRPALLLAARIGAVMLGVALLTVSAIANASS